MKQTRVIISGGGTGGHIFPAISIASAIKSKRPDAKILFVGALGKMEMEKVPQAGYEIIGIPARGLKRPLYSPSNIGVILDYFKCKRRAGQIIKEFQPDLAVGVGGYASAAIVSAAEGAGIPVVLQEQNSFAGLVNRKNAAKATKICVAYDNMERFFPKEKIVFTGNPIRKEIKPASPQLRGEGYKFYNLNPDKKTVFVVGGSLGCRTLNEWMKKEIAEGTLFGDEKEGCQVIWQCGKYYKDEIASFMKGRESGNIVWTDFIKRMDLAYAVADVVISRAGAGTISELCEAGKCTVFVPSPMVAEDHQTHNAMALVNKEAALMVKDSEAVEKLGKTVSSLLLDNDRRVLFENNIKALAREDSAAQIADICLGIIDKKR